MSMFEKHFTLAEAQALVPWVRSVFGKLQLALDAFVEGPDRLSRRRFESQSRNGHTDTLHAGHAHAADPRELIAGLTQAELKELIEQMIRGVEARGIVIQDARRGLIDFPALRGGTDEVLLCYELADGARITHWHDNRAGFAGRRPIQPGEFD